MKVSHMENAIAAQVLKKVGHLLPAAGALVALGRMRADSVAGAVEYIDNGWDLLDARAGTARAAGGAYPNTVRGQGRAGVSIGITPRMEEAAKQRAGELTAEMQLLTPVPPGLVIQSWYRRGLARWVLGRSLLEDATLLSALKVWAEKERA